MFAMSSENDSSSEPLVTTADFARALEEHENLVRLLAESEKKLEAFRLLLGPAKFERLRRAGAAGDERGLPTWPEMVESLLKDSPDGLTYKQLRQRIAQTPLAESLQKSPNNFFNTIKRLESHHRVIRRGKIVFWPAHLTRKLAAGDVIEEPEDAKDGRGGVRSGVPALVVRILSKSSRPLTASEVVLAAEADPEGARLLAESTQGVYAALSRLAKKKQLRRSEDKRYSLVSEHHADLAEAPSRLL
jgi:hypothetical protein